MKHFQTKKEGYIISIQKIMEAINKIIAKTATAGT